MISPVTLVLRLAMLIVAFGLVVGFAIGCGGNGGNEPPGTLEAGGLPGEAATEEGIQDAREDSSALPALTVAAGGTSIEAAVGSFCSEVLCGDVGGWVSTVEVLEAAAGDLTATLAGETIANADVQAIESSAIESQNAAGRLTWTGEALRQAVTLPSTVAGATIDVDISSLEQGTYVLSFLVYFEGGGDVSYGVLLGVDPDD